MSVRMRGFKKYTPLSVALESIMSNVRIVGHETVPFHRAVGRVLAEDIAAKNDVPPFDRSAMDGFAVRASDTFGATPTKPVELRVTGSVGIGVSPKATVGDGDALKIMTGAPLPKGADAVVMVEHTELTRNELRVFSAVTPGKNVSKKGEDVLAGEVVLKRGESLRPQDIGMLAAVGATRVKVFRKPRVAIISTGEELVRPRVKPPLGKVIDSNTYSLSAAVTEARGIPHVMGRIPDDASALTKIIKLSLRDDLVLISGGSSVGELDLVPEVISKLGKLLFHGVSLRPGGPTAFGVIRRKPVFSLAGFPLAALVAFSFLVRPALLVMQGLPHNHGRRVVHARLSKDVSSSLGRSDVVRVRLREERGETWAEPVGVTGSGILSSMTKADGFVVIPESYEGFHEGRIVEVELY
jgi:molybdopterin molybdotransferase